MTPSLTCARCRRRIQGAAAWLSGYPFGPVCAKKLDLSRKTQDRAARVVRDTRTLDLFAMEA